MKDSVMGRRVHAVAGRGVEERIQFSHIFRKFALEIICLKPSNNT
jgi:hypothetical protein